MSASNITKGLSLKGKPACIPDCSRVDLPEFFVSRGYKTGVEIGVYKGEFTKEFCDKGLKMYGIDPWKAYGNYFEKDKYKYLGQFQKRQDFLFDHTKRTLDKYIKNGKCELIRKTSMEAVEDFEDNSLDFIYIDGHHGFRYIAEDLVEWTGKIRSGGVVSGHDYAFNKKGPRDPYVLHVKYVLHAFTQAYDIGNWYVLGADKPKGERVKRDNRGFYTFVDENGNEEIRDQWRSWFWIKK